MKFAVAKPDVEIRKMKADGARFQKDLRAAAVIATDRASRDGQRDTQARIRSVGLGKLGGAVGQTSTKRERSSGDPYGVIFARGGDKSQGGGTLEAYSRGATITSGNGAGWLWIPTKAVPKFVAAAGRRFRTTAALYRASGMESTIGKLVFKPIGPGKALLVIKKAAVNIRTGRARTPLKRKSKVSTNEKDVVAFVGIRVTRRAARFDQHAIMLQRARRMPRYMKEALDEIRGRRR